MRIWNTYPVLILLLFLSLNACSIYDKLTGITTTSEDPATVILETKAIAKAYALTVADLASKCTRTNPDGSCAAYAITHAQAEQQLAVLRQVSDSLKVAAGMLSANDANATDKQIAIAQASLAGVLSFLTQQLQQGQL